MFISFTMDQSTAAVSASSPRRLLNSTGNHFNTPPELYILTGPDSFVSRIFKMFHAPPRLINSGDGLRILLASVLTGGRYVLFGMNVCLVLPELAGNGQHWSFTLIFPPWLLISTYQNHVHQSTCFQKSQTPYQARVTRPPVLNIMMNVQQMVMASQQTPPP